MVCVAIRVASVGGDIRTEKREGRRGKEREEEGKQEKERRRKPRRARGWEINE
jgi:hypothetical protein